MSKKGSEELGHRRQEEEVGSYRWRIQVATEIRRWSKQILERPSDHFNGLPPCPFARKAWAEKKVKISFGGKDKVMAYCKNWDDSLDLLIVVTEDWDWSDIDEWCEGENDKLSDDDLTLMAFVPGEGDGYHGQPEEEMEDWDHLLDDPYAMVFIQRLSAVNAASKKLEDRGYYKNCTATFLEYVKTRRERSSNAWKQEDAKEGSGPQEEDVVWVG